MVVAVCLQVLFRMPLQRIAWGQHLLSDAVFTLILGRLPRWAIGLAKPAAPPR